MHRGTARHFKKDVEGAVADYTRAIDLDTRCVMAYVNRGVALLDQSRVDAAIADLERALKIGTPDPALRALAEKTLAKARERKP